MAVTSYLTIARAADAEVEAKRSRFLCHVERVADEDAARAVVERMRKQRWDARHHCSAFVRGREVSDVVAVVTRYFGGVLLGAGGLVRAYGDAVGAALDEAGIVERRLRQRYDVPVDHADVGKLENELRSRGVAVLGVDYAERATLHVAVPAGDTDLLSRLLAELTGGTTEANPVGKSWIDF